HPGDARRAGAPEAVAVAGEVAPAGALLLEAAIAGRLQGAVGPALALHARAVARVLAGADADEVADGARRAVVRVADARPVGGAVDDGARDRRRHVAG